MKELKEIISKWSRESKNPRNDGWVRQGYRERLKELQDFIKGQLEENER